MADRNQGGAAGRGLKDGAGARTGQTQDKARGKPVAEYTDRDQLKPQGSPADKRPTDPESVAASDLPERDKQYGSDDN